MDIYCYDNIEPLNYLSIYITDDNWISILLNELKSFTVIIYIDV